MIATYALCSFSNFIAAGVQMSVLGGMSPQKKPLISKLIMRALMAGCISCFVSACIAGKLNILFENTRELFVIILSIIRRLLE